MEPATEDDVRCKPKEVWLPKTKGKLLVQEHGEQKQIQQIRDLRVPDAASEMSVSALSQAASVQW